MMKLFVRPLTDDEQRQVEQLLRSADAATYRHARVVQLSSQGQTVAQITAALGLCDRQVRKVIHGFTQQGIATLPRRKAPGRQRLCDPTARTALAELLRRPPTDFGIESATWTGADLAAVARRQGIAPALSARTARREIQRAGYRWQQAKRWSAQEPEYERKKAVGAPRRAGAGRSELGPGV
jgi:transposase